MHMHKYLGTRQLGLAAAAAVALGLATAGPAGAASHPTTPASYSSSYGSAVVANDTLTVVGTRHADKVALRLAAGQPATLEVDFGDDGSAERTFDRGTFTKINVFLLRGDDTFRIDQTNGAFADEALTVDGGSGNDTLNGGDGADLFFGGGGNDVVEGEKGNDTAHLGSGNDTFGWDPGDGSDIVEGDSGYDTLDFDGAAVNEVMSLSANGHRSLFLRDVGNIRMDMNNVEKLDLTALGGTDTVTVNDMTGTDFRDADIDLSGPNGGGDGAADLVTVNGTDRADHIKVEAHGSDVNVEGLPTETHVKGAEPIDKLQVNALGGNDTVKVDDAAKAIMAVSVDLGADQH
jgi:hypothetical protein